MPPAVHWFPLLLGCRVGRGRRVGCPLSTLNFQLECHGTGDPNVSLRKLHPRSEDAGSQKSISLERHHCLYVTTDERLHILMFESPPLGSLSCFHLPSRTPHLSGSRGLTLGLGIPPFRISLLCPSNPHNYRNDGPVPSRDVLPPYRGLLGIRRNHTCPLPCPQTELGMYLRTCACWCKPVRVRSPWLVSFNP